MTALHLSDRLYMIASMVTPGNNLADVGCDHGYLPIWLVSRGIIPKAVALDVNRGPLLRAEEHIRSCGLESRIETRLSDGLSSLRPGECRTLVIAGMGGPLMERILEEGMELLPGFDELILQPQSDIPHFRRWLFENGLLILDEKMVKEDGKFYTAIKACIQNPAFHNSNKLEEINRATGFRDAAPTDLELYCGPVLLEARGPVLLEYLLFRRRVCGEIMDSLCASGSTAAEKRRREVEEELGIIREALRQAGVPGLEANMTRYYTVTIDGENKEYPEGTTFREISADYQSRFQHQIILARADGKLCELGRRLSRNCTLRFVTTADTPGHNAYKRTAVFILLKAIYDTVGKKNVEKAVIRCAVDNGIYFTMEGMNGVTQEFLDQVKEKMNEIVRKDIVINKRSISTDDAQLLFHKHHMYDKEKLFRYRRSSTVNVYSIENFDDYYYGYMADRTGAAGVFDLRLYDHGFLLLLPRKTSPETLDEPAVQDKIFHVQMETKRWGEKLHVATVGDLNDLIAQGAIRDIILIQEALHEARISAIAEKIAEKGNVRFVMIAGPSSSGKTSFSHRLSVQLSAHGLRPHPIAVDNYFVNREDTPLDENGEKNYECIEAIDTEGFNRDMQDLLHGKEVLLPTYNFITGEREYRGDSLKLGEEDILVIEGIHGLNDALTYSLPDESKFYIYISALTQLNIDEHNRIPTTDGRLIRRIVRDARTRGVTAEETIRRWPSVRRGENENIFRFQERADVMLNSTLVYELACLKIYAEPLLAGIPKDSEEFDEAKRLLKFFDYFLPVPGDDVPNNSLLREFIGGSIFRV